MAIPKHQAIIKSKQGIRLDIGGGQVRKPGWVNIDMTAHPSVDIVWDIEQTPWPLPDESVLTATASHVLEHINPHKGVFIKVMDEIWRVLKPEGQFAFVVPYAGSSGFYQDPTHCNPINEATMCYFDPLDASMLYTFYKPKPWKIEAQYVDRNGLLECLLSKRREDPSYRGNLVPNDLTQERIRVKPHLL